VTFYPQAASFAEINDLGTLLADTKKPQKISS
jgi:hypothetical protein